MTNQPIYVLNEDTTRTTGKTAQNQNIQACKTVAEAVKTTLGPRGMDKMMVDSIGDITVTNDGVTILQDMELEHPAAKMMVEVAQTQEEEIGDGTTTAAVLAGELLKQSQDLLEQDIHPTVITGGYRQAKEQALNILENLGQEIQKEDTELLEKVAETSMTGKSAESSREQLAQLVVEAVKKTGKLEMVKKVKRQGQSVEDTELVNGMIFDKQKTHNNMPETVENPSILLLDQALEVEGTQTEAEINISNPGEMTQFIKEEEDQLKEMVDHIVDSGADTVFCSKGIDDIAQHYLAKNNVLACRRIELGDLEKLAAVSGAGIITNVKDISPTELGQADKVEQKTIGDEPMMFVRGCRQGGSVSILVRGGTEHVVDEVDRALEDALGGVHTALKHGSIVGGGGATEVELAQELRTYADSVGGREQLAINKFADALEIVPRTLAENAGMDPIDTLVSLRNKHDSESQWVGVDAYNGECNNLFDAGVLEPLNTKIQAIQAAAEASELILRIDDNINASGESSGTQQQPPQAGGGMPGGMGGMM